MEAEIFEVCRASCHDPRQLGVDRMIVSWFVSLIVDDVNCLQAGTEVPAPEAHMLYSRDRAVRKIKWEKHFVVR